MKKSLLLLIIGLGFLGQPALAEHNRHDWAFSANIGGGGIRYFLTKRLALEALGQVGDDVVAGGARQYFIFNPQADQLHFYLGFEVDYLSFDTDTSDGNGFAYAGFVGGEFFVHKNFSLQTDFGGAWVDLEDDDTTVTEDGFEMVVNIGLQWYFHRGRK